MLRPDSDHARTALTTAFDADPLDRFNYSVRLLRDGARRELVTGRSSET